MLMTSLGERSLLAGQPIATLLIAGSATLADIAGYGGGSQEGSYIVKGRTNSWYNNNNMPRVYIGRLSYHVREKDIQRFFSGYGKLMEIDLKNGYVWV